MLSWERASVAEDCGTRAVVSHFSAFRRVQGVVLLGRRGIRRSAVRVHKRAPDVLGACLVRHVRVRSYRFIGM